MELEPKRDALGKVLAELGMTPTIPEGGYFMLADISNLSEYINLILEFCKSEVASPKFDSLPEKGLLTKIICGKRVLILQVVNASLSKVAPYEMEETQ